MKITKLTFDMHCHCLPYSTCAVHDEDQLIARFVEEGLTVVSVTNHDTVMGLKQIKEKCEKLGIRFIPGCEFSAQVKDAIPGIPSVLNIHILGYYIDDNEDLIRSYKDRYAEANKEKLILKNKLYSKRFGVDVPLTYNKFEAKRLLLANGVTSEEFKEYNASDEIVLNCTNEHPSISEIIELIHKLGGIAVLAHPFNYKTRKISDEQCLQIVGHCIASGVDGIEVLHPDTCAKGKTDELLKIVRDNNLIFTVGSDVHGPGRLGTKGYFDFDYQQYSSEINEIIENDYWRDRALKRK